MSSDSFLKLGDIQGESTDKVHTDWIEVQSMDMGVALPFSNSSYSSTKGGTNAGRADFGTINVSKFMDTASVKIIEKVGTGKTSGDAEINLCQSGDGTEKHTYLKIKLTNVFIVNYNVGLSAHDPDRPVENFSLAFEKIEYGYKNLENAGKAGAEVKFAYSLKENAIA